LGPVREARSFLPKLRRAKLGGSFVASYEHRNARVENAQRGDENAESGNFNTQNGRYMKI
jgi:hypothetical protein